MWYVVCLLRTGYRWEKLTVVGRFTYLDNCVAKNSSMITRISKTRALFAGLIRLCHQPEVSLNFKGLMYCFAVRSLSLWDFKTWSLRAEDVCLDVFDRRCLHGIAGLDWSGIECRFRVFYRGVSSLVDFVSW